MNKSIIFFDATTKLINPNDNDFIDKNLVELFISNEESLDKQLTKIISHNLLLDEFTNIIIPACFGSILSDFLGLRLATHIRCTEGINQHANIFLYSFTGIQDYFPSECFNLLKTKGVFLIDYNIDSIISSTLINEIKLSKISLVNQVKKLKFDVPLNYEDTHSIANEWAIYRWANTIEATDGEIVKIESKLENDLYFKYLKTIYPISKFQLLKEDDLKLNFEGKPTVLYIDDEAEKGWKEIFEKILIDNNNDFIHLGNEFNEKTKNEVVEFSLKEVIDEDVDLVILDFRLHKEDFEKIPIEDITGYQILKRIKEYNKGIQVIIFSATNKLWNLQALQEAGADGFILKESPENTYDSDFINQSVLNMIQSLKNCLNMTFLKEVRTKLNQIKQLSKKNVVYENFFSSIESDLEISFELLINTKLSNEYFRYCYLQLFQIIENYVSNENVFIEGEESFVILKNQDICVQKRSSLKVERPLKLTKNGKYEIKHDQITIKNKYNPTRRLDTNFKVSAVLIYKYGHVNSSVKKWTDLNKIRNTKAAHYNPDNEINSNDIFMLIDFISYFIDATNEHDTNVNKGLKKRTFEESKESLLNDSGNFKISKLKK